MEMKLEVENFEFEKCCICYEDSVDLQTLEEYDALYAAANSKIKLPLTLRTLFLQLNNNKALPDGRICGNCVGRAISAHEFSSLLATQAPPPLNVKIHKLRQHLLDVASSTNVFIVVGGPGEGKGGDANSYSEDDIIMVEKDVLEAAIAKDNVSSQNTRPPGSHAASMTPGPSDLPAWSCNASSQPGQASADLNTLHCHICNTSFQSHSEFISHEDSCMTCHICAWHGTDRAELVQHMTQSHPLICHECYWHASSASALHMHQAAHRKMHYVCGYHGCILRFDSRVNFLAHVEKVHAHSTDETRRDDVNSGNFTCPQCKRCFTSVAGLKRHSRVHKPKENHQLLKDNMKQESAGHFAGEDVEYLEEEILEGLSDDCPE